MPKQVEARKEPERVAATEAYTRLSELMNRARFGGERFIITQNGQDAVAIIGPAEFQRLDGAA